MRRIATPSGNAVLASDTVGFISNLPHSLVSAFQVAINFRCCTVVIMHVHVSSRMQNAVSRQLACVICHDQRCHIWTSLLYRSSLSVQQKICLYITARADKYSSSYLSQCAQTNMLLCALFKHLNCTSRRPVSIAQ